MTKRSWREDAERRLNEMAGLCADGNIAPPPADIRIDRSPVTWWKNRGAQKEEKA